MFVSDNNFQLKILVLYTPQMKKKIGGGGGGGYIGVTLSVRPSFSLSVFNTNEARLMKIYMYIDLDKRMCSA